MASDDNARRMEKTFKEVFKYYKRRNADIDLSNVYDFKLYDDATCNLKDKVKRMQIVSSGDRIMWETTFQMLQPETWNVFTFNKKPGLIYIRNPLKPMGERYWIARCLKDFTRKPNCLNIDAHNLLRNDDEWWEFCQRHRKTDEGKSILKKLRWSTFGYQHNWDTKEYNEDLKTEFPEDLRTLCREIGYVLGFKGFNAEAAIINMYHRDSYLNGHTDHSEMDLSAPLFSFSFGQSALFLIGGTSMDEEPLTLLVESGDMIIMSKESRLCYHGVPRILQSRARTWNRPISESDVVCSTVLDTELLSNVRDNNFWSPFDLYVNESRINMNIRQVLMPGQTRLMIGSTQSSGHIHCSCVFTAV